MILSNRNGLKNTRNMLRVFGGLNETYSCTEAEYSAGINFSARNFPALSTRLPRRKLREEADLNGMYHLNGLLTVCGRDLVYTPDDRDEMKVTLKDAVEDGRKTLVHRDEDPDLPGQAGFRHSQPGGERSGRGVVGQERQRGVCTLRRGGQGLRGERLRPC